MKLLLLFLSLVSHAWATPTQAGGINYVYTASTGSVGLSRTTKATTNPCMLVWGWQEASSNSAISAVTFQGSSFTKVTMTTSILNTAYGEAAYYLTGYSSGVLGNITITVSPNDAMSIFVAEFNGVNQSSPIGAIGTMAVSNAASPNAITITTQGIGSLVMSFFGTGYISSLSGCTPPGGYTLLYQNSDDASRNNVATYYISAPSPASVGSTWTWPSTKYNTQLLFELKGSAQTNERNTWIKDRIRLRLKGPLSFLPLLESKLKAQPMNGIDFGNWTRGEDYKSKISKLTATPTQIPVPTATKVVGTVTPTTTVTPTPTPTPKG